MGSALLDSTAEAVPAKTAGNSSSAEALRLQAAERLAAHRSRRGMAPAQPEVSTADSRQGNTRAARIAAAVAERYAKSPSYRAMLAAEAERAVQQARAAAEVAARNARAVAAAQQQLLDGLDEDALSEDISQRDTPQNGGERESTHAEVAEPRAEELSLWPDLEPEGRGARRKSGPNGKPGAKAPNHQSHREPRAHDTQIWESSPAGNTDLLAAREAAPAGGLTVRLYEDGAGAAHVGVGTGIGMAMGSAGRANRQVERNDDEARALDEEIAFRQAPVFEEPAGPPMPLPANLIEFPRQLVASRKARPRYAEGPLRDEALDSLSDGQLRIFEVDPAQISTHPAAVDSAADSASALAPQWTSIWLDAPAPAQRTAAGQTPGTESAESLADAVQPSTPLPQVASLGRRLLAAVINGCVILAGLLAFAAAFAAATGHAAELRSGASILALLREIAGRVPGDSGVATGAQPSLLLAAAGVAGGFLYLLYQGLFFSLNGATPGMRCARIALCTFDDENPTRRAMRRRIVAVLLSACPFGLGFLWAALDEDRLTWHDRVSRMYQRSY